MYKRINYFRGIVLQLGKSVMKFMMFEYFLGLYTGSECFGAPLFCVANPLMPSKTGDILSI